MIDFLTWIFEFLNFLTNFDLYGYVFFIWMLSVRTFVCMYAYRNALMENQFNHFPPFIHPSIYPCLTPREKHKSLRKDPNN